MSGAFEWRPFQHRFINTLGLLPGAELLRRGCISLHGTTGSGKSAIPVIAAHNLVARRLIDRVVVVVPRDTLREQAAREFTKEEFRLALGHRLEVYSARNEDAERIDRGTNGYVTTYQSLTAALGRFSQAENPHVEYFRRHRCLLALDEVHHAAVNSPTHDALELIYSLARFRLLLSGTPDRNDGRRVAYLDYRHEAPDGRRLPHFDITFGYREAIASRSIIRTEFVRYDAAGNYIGPRGQRTWFGTLSHGGGRRALYTALQTEYAQELLCRCVRHWRAWRAGHPRSKLLVVCATQGQARQATAQLQEMGVRAGLAISDDGPLAAEAIGRFSRQDGYEALVTVQMAYEGMDVKPITHVACLTHIRSEPWLLQMFGRAMRHDPEAGDWRGQWAYIFAPDDPEMHAAIEYLVNEQALGAADIGESCQPDVPGNLAGPGPNAGGPPPAAFTPLDSQATRVRISGPEPGDQVGYSDAARMAEIMEENGLVGSVTAFAAALRQFQGCPLSPLDDGEQEIVFDGPTPTPTTPRERTRALQLQCQAFTNRLDQHEGCEGGTWNRRCFLRAQNGRSRTGMPEGELVLVRDWLARRLRERGINPDTVTWQQEG